MFTYVAFCNKSCYHQLYPAVLPKFGIVKVQQELRISPGGPASYINKYAFSITRAITEICIEIH